MDTTITADTLTADGLTTFGDLLRTATTEPGTIAAAYSLFWQYSMGNQLLAVGQCAERGIELGPIATFNGWKKAGRHVTKGQKALRLCMPITSKRTDAATGETVTFSRFVFRNNWFTLAQTDGEPYTPPVLPAWDAPRALAALDVTTIPFAMLDGNVQGYALARSVSVSPVAAFPVKTLCHELAHVLLGHTAEGQLSDDERTPRSLREAEAEGVALLCCAALGLPGAEESRGYIQNWYGAGQAIPETSARKIFKTADQILKAGRPATTTEVIE